MAYLSKPKLFLVLLLLGFVWQIGLFFNIVKFPSDLSLAAMVFSFNRHLTDALIVAGVCLLLFSPKLPLRVLSYSVACFCCFVFFVQYQSVRYSGAFLPTIAVENARHANLIDLSPVWFGGVFFIAATLLAFFLLSRVRQYGGFGFRIGGFLILIVAAVLLKNDHKWLPESLLNERLTAYRVNYAAYANRSPVSELFETLAEGYATRQKLLKMKGTANALDPTLNEFAFKHGIPWATVDPKYPLLKIESTPPLDGLHTTAYTSAPNIIVFFAEGLSARTIQPYSNKFPGISENIEEFSRHAIRIDNYYNHTFATYRGLSGAHCSLFPAYNTQDSTRYRCLPHILNETGYDTVFAYSQKNANTELDEMATRVGFNKVLSYQDLQEGGVKQKSGHSNDYYLSDKRLVRGLIAKLQNWEANNEQPFYLGIYNFETHTGVGPLDKSLSYRGSDNYILNSIHNFDQAFGELWDFFKNSSYAKNTILVFTSDHAHFPDSDYMSLWQDDDYYSPVFMDRVPLLIYSPFHQQVAQFGVKESSTLDFAPSLLHFLGVTRYENTFLGKSIFDKKFRMRPVAMGNSNMWYASQGMLGRLSDREKNPNFHLMQKLIKQTQALELQNKLWPERPVGGE